jgi:hypothetical protein
MPQLQQQIVKTIKTARRAATETERLVRLLTKTDVYEKTTER